MAQEGVFALFARNLHCVANLVCTSVELLYMSMFKLALESHQLSNVMCIGRGVLTT